MIEDNEAADFTRNLASRIKAAGLTGREETVSA